MVRFDFFTDPREFLALAEGCLRADPVVSTVVAAVTESAAADDAAGVVPDPAVPRWWVVARSEDGAVTGVAMRTASSAPYPVYCLPMPEVDAVALGRVLRERGDDITMVNGALPAARVVAEELAGVGSGRVVETEHTRLFEATAIQQPPRPPGRLRAAGPGDVTLVAAWFAAFRGDANEQAGRARDSTPDIGNNELGAIQRRIERGQVWLWSDPAGRTVHLTATTLPAQGVVRIGPVFTPAGERGRGYAAAAVAEVSAGILAQGWRACLFTDQANPTSNALYQRLGYRAVTDMGALVVEIGDEGSDDHG